MKRQFPHLTAPLPVGGHTYKNRIIASPVSQPFYSVNGCLTQQAHAYLVDQARGGAAQVTLGEQPVDPALAFGKGFDILGPELGKAAEISLARLVQDVHSYGALISMELGHPGEGFMFPPGVKGKTYGPMGYTKEDGTQVVALDEELMDMVCQQFAFAAQRLKYLGFDGAVIHSAHGCLLAQFLSARTNRREDGFGGSLENRARFPIMVLQRIRERVGPDFIVELRISGSECIDGGIDVDENIAFCNMLDGLVDLIHVSAGIYAIPELFVRTHPVIYYPNGCNADLAGAIRRGIHLPVAVVGAINTPELAEQILAEGKADLVALGRQMIADPWFARKAVGNAPGDIAPCIRCLNCMDISAGTGMNLNCSVNPRAGRVIQFPVEFPPAPQLKKVVVIGGGPGGMEAALTARLRGHQVVLFEKRDSLGGTLWFADIDVFKKDLRRYRDYLAKRVVDAGVDVRLGVEATPELVEAEAPDAVIAAVGASPVKPPIPGLDGANVIHALDAYRDVDRVGRRVVMVGGGLVGCETGIHLAKLGREVTIVELSDTVAADCQSPHRIGLMDQLAKLATVYTGLRCQQIDQTGVVCTDGAGQEVRFDGDTVIYALGMRPHTALAHSFRDCALQYAAVGDCVKAGKVMHAVQQGYFAALDI